MDTPLGLVYKPVFPSTQSLFAQLTQMRMLKEKQKQEDQKNALTQANQAVSEFMKFNPKHPFQKATEPWFQQQIEEVFALQRGVKNGSVEPQMLQEKMARVNQAAETVTRKSAFFDSQKDVLEKNGFYDIDLLNQTYTNYGVDLNATAATGKVTNVHPDQVDMIGMFNDYRTNLGAYKTKPMSQAFVKQLMDTNASVSMSDDSLGVQRKTTTLQKPFQIQLGKSGMNVVSLGPINSDQSLAMLSTFRNMNPAFDSYIQLRAAKEFPEDVAKGGDAIGEAMQKSLQNLMVENGSVPYQETVGNTPKETGYNKSFVGGSAQAQDTAEKAAAILNRLITNNNDKGALGYFKGSPLIESTTAANGILTMKFKQGKVDKLAELISRSPELKDLVSVDEEKGVATVELTHDNIPALVNFKNIISSSHDWIPENVEEVYQRDYAKKPAAKAAPAPIVMQDADAVDLDDAPTPADLKEFIDNAAPGTKYKIKGKVYTKK